MFFIVKEFFPKIVKALISKARMQLWDWSWKTWLISKDIFLKLRILLVMMLNLVIIKVKLIKIYWFYQNILNIRRFEPFGHAATASVWKIWEYQQYSKKSVVVRPLLIRHLNNIQYCFQKRIWYSFELCSEYHNPILTKLTTLTRTSSPPSIKSRVNETHLLSLGT